ncbi:hypothetical protein BD289DRAFT_501524, partial [Coniella lustricola]
TVHHILSVASTVSINITPQDSQVGLIRLSTTTRSTPVSRQTSLHLRLVSNPTKPFNFRSSSNQNKHIMTLRRYPQAQAQPLATPCGALAHDKAGNTREDIARDNAAAACAAADNGPGVAALWPDSEGPIPESKWDTASIQKWISELPRNPRHYAPMIKSILKPAPQNTLSQTNLKDLEVALAEIQAQREAEDGGQRNH